MRNLAKAFICFCICCYPDLSYPEDTTYYYTQNGQQPLVASGIRLCVQIDTSALSFDDTTFLQAYESLDDTGATYSIERGVWLLRLAEGYEFSDAAAEVAGDSMVIRSCPVFLTTEGVEVVVTDVICIKFQGELSSAEADSILVQHGLHFLDSTGYRHNRWDVALDDTNSGATIDIANALSGLSAIEWACPSIYTDVSMQGPILDPYFQYQYYLRDESSDGGLFDVDIDADSAWLFSLKNQDFLVAVIDGGLAPHPDLDLPRLRMDLGRDFVGIDPLNPQQDSIATPGDCANHGMACAGILAASHNDIGVRGVFGDCQVVPIKVWSDDEESVPNIFDKATVYEKAIQYACSLGARVISCSWSFPFVSAYNPIAEAILFGTYGCFDEANLRPGAIFVVAAGNSSESNKPVLFPASMDGFTIAVGALDKSNSRWDYSCYGSALDIMAPAGNAVTLSGASKTDCSDQQSAAIEQKQSSESQQGGDMWTIDQVGSRGWHTTPGEGDAGDVDYTSIMGGTSGACPQVAGVAGLVLARRPDFDQCFPIDIVYDVLTGSAEDIAPSGWDSQTGYGRLNAYRAMLAVARCDANGDALYDIADVIEAMHQADASLAPLIHKGLSDLNCDGVVDGDDVTIALDIVFNDASWPDPCFEFDY